MKKTNPLMWAALFFGAILFKEIDPFFMLRLMHSTLNQLRAAGK
jgi:hypothetical protein